MPGFFIVPVNGCALRSRQRQLAFSFKTEFVRSLFLPTYPVYTVLV